MLGPSSSISGIIKKRFNKEAFVMEKSFKIQSKENPELYLTVTPGHFSSDRFHVNYYIDMTTLKMRQSQAELVAYEMSKKYVNRINLQMKSHAIDDHMMEMARVYADKTPIDTIICMDGCEVIGAYLAQELSEMGVTSNNKHHTFYVISPEFDSSGQMVVRDNIKPMIKGKNVLVILATAMSGRTILKSIKCITAYGGKVQGISVIFGAVDQIEGYPVNAVFSKADLPDFELADASECHNCKDGKPLDAIVNSYGYSTL